MKKDSLLTTLQTSIALFFMLLLPLSASAYDFMVNGLCYEITSDNTVEVVRQNNTSTPSYSNISGSVVIPSSVTFKQKSYSVTSVGYWAFFGCTNITSVKFPSTVTSIDDDAFYNCTNLATVTATSSLAKIGDGVFHNTSWESNLSYGMKYLGSVAYLYNGTLSSGSSVTINSGTLGIAGGCFRGQSGLKKITIPSTVTSIGGCAFINCSSLTSITIPSSVQFIGMSAFDNCSSLSSISFPNSLLYIGMGAFDRTAWYNNKSNGMVYAGSVAYKYKGTMPNNTNITITSGTKGIAEDCFDNCTGLSTITIPSSVVTIGNQAFMGCTGLTKVNISNIKSWCSIDFGTLHGTTANPLEFAHHLYLNNEEVTELKLPSYYNNLRVKRNAFWGCTGLESVEISSSFISIDDDAFAYCTGLTDVTINNSVKSIGNFAFYGCTGLTSIRLPDELNFMGSCIFNGCTNLNAIKFKNENPGSITTLSSLFDTFGMYCTLHVLTGTASIYQSNSYWQNCYIVDDLFPEIYFVDDAVKQICLNNWDTNEDGELSYDEAAAVTDLGDIFRGNSNIKRFPELQYFTSLNTINAAAFRNCENLYEVVFPNGLETIDSYAFKEAAISTVNLPASLKTIVGTPFDGLVYHYDEDGGGWYSRYPSRYNVAANNQYFSSSGNLLYNKDQTILIDIPYGKDGAISLPSTVKGCLDAFDCDYVSKINVNTRTWYEMDFSNAPRHTYNDYDDDDNLIVCDLVYDGTTAIPYRGNVILPEGIQKIGSRNFEGVTGLISISIPNTVTSIGERSFFGCSGLTSLSIPYSVSSIGNNAFQGCRSINSIVVASGNPIYDSRDNCNAIIETASNTLLYGCKNTTIPGSVTTIGGNAFNGCNGMLGITIPNSITCIGDNAFYGCSGLTHIYCNIEDPSSITMGSSVFYNVPKTSCVLHVPVGTIDAYRAANQWKDFTNIVEIEIVEHIEFVDPKVETLCVTNWDTNYDRVLTNEEAAAVTDLGEVFKNNTEITSFDELQFFTGLTSISSSAFYGCTGLSSVTIPNTITAIGSSAFYNCSAMPSVTIPNSVTTIGNGAFYGCSGLTQVHISNIATWCSVSFGNSIANPLYYAKHLYLDDAEVTELIIPNTVTSINKYAFLGCSGLTTICIPNSVASIGNEALAFCNGLSHIFSSIENPASATMGSSVFYNVSKASCILHVPSGTIEAYRNANQWKDFTNIVDIAHSTVPVTSLALSQTTAEVTEGETLQLTATVLPEDASDKSVTWVSNDETVATVNNNGLVTAVATGTAIITATTNDGTDLTSSCEVTVSMGSISPQPTANRLFIEDFSIVAGMTKQVELLMENENAYTAFQIDLVMPEGLCIETDSNGKPMVTINEERADNHQIVTNIRDDGRVSILIMSLESTPIMGTSGPIISFNLAASNDFSGTHRIEIINAEMTTLAGMTTKPDDTYCTVTGLEFSVILASSIELDYNNVSLTEGITLQLAATVLPDDATDKTVTWATSNEAVATVDANGLVTAVAPGTATITATTNDGSDLTANCELVVLPAILLGDVNGDDDVTVSDVVLTAQKAVGMSPSLFVNEAAGDVNGDGQITVADVVLIANIAVGAANAPRYAPATITNANDRLTASALDLEAGNTQTIELSLDNTTAFTAFQMDLRLPEGVEVVDVKLGDRVAGHALLVNETNGVTRVMGFSMDNNVIKGSEGTLLNVTLRANNNAAVDAVEVKDVLMVERDGTTHQLDDLMLTNALTSLNGVVATARIYGQNGAIVIEAPVSGVAIVVMPNGMTRTIKVQSGHNVVKMQHGLYIVRMSDKVAKIIL